MTAARTPGYQAILQRLQDDIAEKALLPGQLVPSHRAMAKACGVSTATVTRAYNEAIRQGLLTPLQGKGTCVAGQMHHGATTPASFADLHNLATNAPTVPRHLNSSVVLHDAFTRLAGGQVQALLARSDQTHELPHHVEQVTAWFSSLGIPSDQGAAFITPGAQAALLVALRTLASGGAAIACEPLINSGLRAAADFVGARLVPVACDDEGPLPDALITAIEKHGVRTVYASPTSSNPLALHWGVARRREIAELATQRRLWIVEDDDYLPLDPNAMPLCSLAPERTLVLLGLSKITGFMMRTGFAWVPHALAEDYRRHLRAAVWMTSPILAEVATHWLASGVLGQWIEARRSEAAEHQSLAMRALGRHGYRGPTYGTHGWLPLSLPWDAERFMHFAQRHGVAVTPGTEFRLPRRRSGDSVQGVRLSLCSTQSTQEFHVALGGLATLLDEGPQSDY